MLDRRALPKPPSLPRRTARPASAAGNGHSLVPAYDSPDDQDLLEEEPMNAAIAQVADTGADAVPRTGGGFEFDYDHNVVYMRGNAIHLTPMEADIFQVLLQNRGRVARPELLIRRVYGAFEPEGALGCIRTAISTLRKKISETGINIKTRHSLGYEIDASTIPELNRRLSDKILIALNQAEALGETDVAEILRAAFERAEQRRQHKHGTPQ